MAVATIPRLEEIRNDREGTGDRVLLRAVRRPVRTAEREARPGCEPRRPRHGGRGLRRASRPARSARSRAIRTSPRSPTSTASRSFPWQPNLARFACDVTVEGEPWPYCPRTILRRQWRGRRSSATSSSSGSSSSTSSSAQREDGSIEIADAADTLEKPCYDMAGLTRQYDFLTTVSRYCNELGWGNYANDHEDANGQFEQNFTYDDALVSCDRAIFFRYMVHTLAEQHGMIATFMPKPFTHLTGNGCHFHMSLWRDGENLFLDEDDPRGLRSLRDGVQLHRRPEGARARLQRADRADGQLLQAPQARLDGERRDLVAGLDLLRLQQPHADAAHPGARADRGPHDRRLGEPVPRRGRRARLRARRDRERLDAGEPNCGEPLRRELRDAHGARACARCRRTCSRRSASSSATTSCAAALGAGAARTTSTTTRG